mmetsp:Transcript_13668/g.43215  ORF Transcript_13668/g.43215 Transcript_13668/m.43215 type:complete len:348 (-) Transcript_13668:309-1352(-)
MASLSQLRPPTGSAMRALRRGYSKHSCQIHTGPPSGSSEHWRRCPALAGMLRRRASLLPNPCLAQRRVSTQGPASGGERSSFLGIFGNKEEQIALKNSDVDKAGIWPELPEHIRKSLNDPTRSEFISWLGHGVTRGKAAIIRLVTEEEAAAIAGLMETEAGRPGVMSTERVAELYVGRVNTSRHLISDEKLAECFFQRIRHCAAREDDRSEDRRVGQHSPLLASLQHGRDVVCVSEKIRLVTTEGGGEHQKHADVSERSDDGSRVSRLTFQCYLNPERYEGGHFQLYPEGSEVPVDVPMCTGSAVIFVQEDPELMHGGGRTLGGEAKRAIRGNLDVAAPAESAQGAE